jgi:hypothetical protein
VGVCSGAVSVVAKLEADDNRLWQMQISQSLQTDSYRPYVMQ